MDRLPLEGIRVADFTWALSGPYSLEWLSVMGAEVIRIESTLRPDGLRTNPFVTTGVEAGLNQAAGYNCLNYAKKSCTINLHSEKGIALAKQIIMKSDMVSDSFAYGVMERYGLGYENLKKMKPDLVVFSKSAMGAYGRERHLFGWGTAVISYAGLAAITGYEEDGIPRMMGGTWPDYTIGTYSPFTILSALYHKKKTGQGMFIDYSMCEGVITMIPEAVMDYTLNGRVATPRSNKDETMAPHGIYRCSGDDKWVAIAASGDSEWKELCKIMGRDDLVTDERYSDLFKRQKNRHDLDKSVEDWTKGKTAQEVAEQLQRAGIAAGPLEKADTVVIDEHLRAREQFVEMVHPEVGQKLMPALPVRMSNVPRPKYESAPLIGEYNEYVFEELLGLSRDEVVRLMEENVIV